MEIEHLSANFATSDQMTPADVPAVAAKGFKAIICTRPDSEEEDQPSFALIHTAALEHGLKAFHVPVLSTGATDRDHDAFKAVMRGLEGRVLGYCRTGKRAGVLWTALQEKA